MFGCYFFGELFLGILIVSCIDFEGVCLYFIFSYTCLYVQEDIFELVDFVFGDFVSGDLANGDFALFYLGDCLIIGVSS